MPISVYAEHGYHQQSQRDCAECDQSQNGVVDGPGGPLLLANDAIGMMREADDACLSTYGRLNGYGIFIHERSRLPSDDRAVTITAVIHSAGAKEDGLPFWICCSLDVGLTAFDGKHGSTVYVFKSLVNSLEECAIRALRCRQAVDGKAGVYAQYDWSVATVTVPTVTTLSLSFFLFDNNNSNDDDIGDNVCTLAQG